MKYITQIFKSIFKWMPFSALYTVLDYLYGALVPAIVTVVSVNLFDNAAKVLNGESAINELYLYAILYLVVYFINDISSFVRSITLNAGIYEKGTAYFRMALHEKLAKLPLISFENAEIFNKKERAVKAVNDETLSELFNHSMRFVRSAASVVSVAAVLTQYSLWLLPLSLISIIPYLIARVVRGKEFYYVKRHQARKTRLLYYLWSLFTTRQAAKEMRTMGFDGYITDKWRSTRDEVNEELWVVQKKDAISLLWCDGFRIAGYGISLVVVLLLVLRGQVSIGVFGAAITAFLSLQNSMQNFLEGLGRFPEQLGYASDYYAFFDMPEEPRGTLKYPGLEESIKLENISFKYPNSKKYALSSINLTIRKGEKIAILGENGSGKTTLSKVLLGLYPVEHGQILYDGRNVDCFEKESLYAGISAIAQDFVSYNLTVRENVAISDISRMNDDRAIQTALSDGGVAQNNLDEMMGREFGGKDLSGGQWQKLAIARGLFKDSEIILLDEPTSALDPLIETDILTKFIRAAEGKTALIISHRIGLCQLVDRIVVMRNGTIVETGTHTELLSSDSEYARLYKEQTKWYNGAVPGIYLRKAGA